MPSIGISPSVSKTFTKEAQPLWQRVKANAAQLVRLKNLSTSDQVLFWSGFTYVPSAILTPIMTDWQLRQSNMPSYEKNLVVKTEIARQAIGAAIHFLFFFGGVLLAGLGGSTKPRTFQKLAAAIVSATLGNAFVPLYPP